jgi:hypothetical protein
MDWIDKTVRTRLEWALKFLFLSLKHSKIKKSAQLKKKKEKERKKQSQAFHCLVP